MRSTALSSHIIRPSFLNMSEDLFTQNEILAGGKNLTLRTLTSVKFVLKDRRLKMNAFKV